LFLLTSTRFLPLVFLLPKNRPAYILAELRPEQVCAFLAYTREHMFVSPPLSPSELRNFFHAYDLECGSNRVFLCPTGSWFFFSPAKIPFSSA